MTLRAIISIYPEDIETMHTFCENNTQFYGKVPGNYSNDCYFRRMG